MTKTKTPAGTPTTLNMFTLQKFFGAATSKANRISAVERNGLSHCLKAGLMSATRETLTLTALGANALCGYAMDRGMSPFGWQSTDCFTYDIAEAS